MEQIREVNTSPERVASARPIVVLGVLVLITEVVALSFQLVTPALPQMAAAFQTSRISWIVTILALVGAIAVPLAAKSADLWGKRKVMVWLSAAMVLGSIVIAVAPTFEVVLVGRVLQGLMVAAMPLTYSLMRDVLPARWLALGASISTTGVGLVTVAGPFLSGYLIESYTFRGVFWFLAGLATLAVVGLLWLVPESPLRLPARLDLIGGVLLGGGVALILVGLTLGPEQGWTSLNPLGSLAGGALALILWRRRQERIEHPLLDLSLIRQRPVWTTIVAGAATMTAVTAAAVLIPLMVSTPRTLGQTYGFGAAPADLPLYLAPAGLATMIGGFAIGGLARSVGPRNLLALGAMLMAVAAALLAFAHNESWHVVMAYCVSGLGSGLALGSLPNIVIAVVPAGQQGVTAGVVSLMQSLGSAAGVQALFIVLALGTVGVSGGQPVYAGSSFSLAFALVAALCVVAVLVRPGRERSGGLQRISKEAQ